MSSNTTFNITPSTTPASAADREQKLQAIQFGRVFTDHMAVVKYSNGTWHDPEVKAYGPLSLDPSASVLHYGQAIFEGFKAYRQPDNSISLFRPEQNAERFNRSAHRLAMPSIPKELFIGAADALVKIDQAWVPGGSGESLYLRPFMIATDPFLGVRPSNEYLFLLIASPAGEYFPQGLKPVSVWASKEYVRAAPGGTGEAKCAGNYAASLLAQAEATQHGCDQVIWLDAIEREYIEEMGGMNLFFVYRKEGKPVIVTPQLTGTLLPGITRSTLLQLAADEGYAAEERRLSLTEVREAIASGEISEVFACGTAAVITPVGLIKGRGFEVTINSNENGPVALALRDALLGIQRGTAADTHGWLHKVALA
ncbi:branched-chain amino acid aminotransferase [Pseudoduganella umbonata]|uniref:Branched-chain-amino-acid aminotransferase n=1 Tax=Pseudoduganella umbonata TaxID=864828 RepID=A0A4P8HQJ0_9BURK|nr:branched-chain amino acid aminotransferase [Pseudoduganella umbonata]MBB3222774.1 branched-chain amino acid aminotransferase [Pseudoduganella umbonata]QCP10734.1 branched-chain amino acid aminotransferase [Pseudoduganella umbonata]